MREQTPGLVLDDQGDRTRHQAEIGNYDLNATSARGIQRSRLDAIARLIEREVIPRMARAHARDAVDATERRSAAFTGTEIREFADATLSATAAPCEALIESQLERGVLVEDLFLHLLAPAARNLGARWEDDSLDFTQVTAGLTRLHVLLHALSRRFAPAGGERGDSRRILLAPNPGEQHVFGPLMVAEFFRRAGWNASCELSMSAADIARRVRTDSLDAVGLSCASERYLDGLERCIRAIRRASRGRPFAVLVGGVAFSNRPELATQIGADAAASDGPAAVKRAETLVPAHRIAI